MNIARQQLRGHVPDVVSKLKPVGPLPSRRPPTWSSRCRRKTRNCVPRSRDIYDPASPRFHQYLSPRQYTEMFDPTEASYQSLVALARANELTLVSPAPERVHPCDGACGSHQQGVRCDVAAVSTPDRKQALLRSRRRASGRAGHASLTNHRARQLRTPRRAPNLLKAPRRALDSHAARRRVRQCRIVHGRRLPGRVRAGRDLDWQRAGGWNPGAGRLHRQ